MAALALAGLPGPATATASTGADGRRAGGAGRAGRAGRGPGRRSEVCAVDVQALIGHGAAELGA